MTAEVVSVGTELLMGQTLDTHSSTLGRLLAEHGIACHRRTTVDDNLSRIEGVLREALERCDLVLTVGGLGPTADDLTRDAIAAALGEPLEPVPHIEMRLREYFASRGIDWNRAIARQALKPRGAETIDNPNGTAPGLHARKDGKTVVALPGPRGEFGPMVEGPLRAILESLAGGETIRSRTLRICGLGESQVEAALGEIMASEDPVVAPYAHPGEVHLRITARGASAEEAESVIEPVERQIREILGANVFGRDDQTLETVVLGLLRERSARVATAESLTGGGLSARLTGIPGASDVFAGGVVAYSAALKESLLGIDADVLQAESPVSEAVARAMAEGARSRLGAEYGLGLTGNAGPTADAGRKPVGQVWVACAGPGGTWATSHRFVGGREDVRTRAAQAALVLLRQMLLSEAER
jgi:nicotinamide-nucleotide amidase